MKVWLSLSVSCCKPATSLGGGSGRESGGGSEGGVVGALVNSH